MSDQDQCLKKVNLILSLALYAMTGGLYGVFWILSRGYCLYFSQKESFKKIFYIAVIITVILYLVLLFFGRDIIEIFIDEKIKVYKLIFILFMHGILIYSMFSIITWDLAKYINRVNNKDLDKTISRLNIVFLTFLGFTSSIYLQYRINKSFYS